MGRNRSEGWKYAKNSGHLNEEMLTNIEVIPNEISNILTNNEVILSFSKSAGTSQKKELSVLGHKTISKVDNVIITNFRELKISLKKSLDGQLLLTNTDIFFNTLEVMYGVSASSEVRETMKLFTGENNLGVKEALKNDKVLDANKKCSISQRLRRLNGDALLIHNPDNVRELLNFISNNMVEITKMVFSTGSVKDKKYHAEYLYYKNLVTKNKSADVILKIEDVVNSVSNKTVEFGPKNGGTTILLPFGHLQMHKNILQIHHSYDKINLLVQK